MAALERLRPDLVQYVKANLIPPGFEKGPKVGWWRNALSDAYIEKQLGPVNAYIHAAKQAHSR